MPSSSLDIIILHACLTLCILNTDVLTDTLANSEDPDDTLKASFHQGLHWLPRLEQSSGKEIN